MAGQERAFEISQAGIETVRGTEVDADRKLYTAWAPWSYEKELRWANNVTGTLAGRRAATYRRPTQGQTGTEDVSFEDIVWWGQLLLKGDVAGVSDAGTPAAYTWDFTKSTTVDDLASATLEYGTVGIPYTANQLMVVSSTIRINPDDEAAWMMDVEAIHRKPEQKAMTAALGERDRELVKAPGTKIFIDDAGGTIGTTQLLNRFIGGSITINNNITFKWFSEHEDDWAANMVGRGETTVDAQFTFEFDTDDEFAEYRSSQPVERLVRIEREGEVIHDAIRSRIRLDLNGYWSSIEPGYRENNKILTFGFGARFNPISLYDLNVEVVNDVASI